MKAKIVCNVFVEFDGGEEAAERVASDFDSGLWNAVDNFPSAEVVAAEVERIEEVTDASELL